MSLNLGTILTESAKSYAGKTAVITHDGRKFTYLDLHQMSCRFANCLDKIGVRPGEKVALLIPNLVHFVVAYFGALYHGAVVVPLNVLLKPNEVEYQLRDSDAVALVTLDVQAAALGPLLERLDSLKGVFVIDTRGEPTPNGALSFTEVLKEFPSDYDLVQTTPQDDAVIIYTSGTTGKPKGAVLTHFNLMYNADLIVHKLFDINETDIVLGILPLFHSFGQTVVMNAFFLTGATVSLQPRFDAETSFQAIQRDRVSILAAVPTMYYYLLRYPERAKFDVSSLRLTVTGGAAMPVELLHEWESEMNIPLLEGYGLSETSPLATFNLSKEKRKVGSIGPPIWGVDLRIFDSEDREVPRGERGEIVIRGHNVMKGYYKKAQETAVAMRNGWFHTGDVGYVDEDGYVFIVDRIKDMILRGGYNVYPREVEEVLYTCPCVAEAAVVGVPNEAMGEEVKAFVVPKPGVTSCEQEIIEFCKRKLASFKCPKSVEFLPELPKGPTGKILKRVLRDRVSE